MASAMVAPPPPRPSPPVASSSAPTASASKQPTFEFTRRKRWAELLVNELSEAIGLVLSPTGRILFSTPSVTELLGWRDQELIDVEFTNLVNVEDQNAFQRSITSAIHERRDILAYARLRCKDPAIAPPTSVNMVGVGSIGDYGYAIPTAGSSTSIPAQPPSMLAQSTTVPTASVLKEVLFEITGYPHFVEPDEEERQRSGAMMPQCKCIFAVAKPYPSRNTAMLNTFLELKMENERLQQRLINVKSRPRSAPSGSSAPKRRRSDTITAQAQRPPVSPVVSHPYSHHASATPQLAPPQQHNSYNSMPVSMQMPVSSLAGATGSGNSAYQPSTYASSSTSFYTPGSFGDYGVGLGLGSSSGGYPGYNTGGSASGLAALVIASTVAESPASAAAAVAAGDRRMSFSAPSGATDHRGMSLPGGAQERDKPEEEEGGRKKKARRHVGEQYVCRTCGRTDSPEWRKGPLGPKTLCNACGLRWAKQVRKGDEKDKEDGGAD